MRTDNIHARSALIYETCVWVQRPFLGLCHRCYHFLTAPSYWVFEINFTMTRTVLRDTVLYVLHTLSAIGRSYSSTPTQIEAAYSRMNFTTCAVSSRRLYFRLQILGIILARDKLAFAAFSRAQFKCPLERKFASTIASKYLMIDFQPTQILTVLFFL